MALVPLAQTPEDRDGVLHARLVDQDRLEAPLERGILLDVLLVLVEGGGPDAVQLAAGQRGLEQVARVHRALRGARADHGVQLVDEEDDLALRLLDRLEHGLQPLLELAAVLGPRDQRAHVQGDDALALEALRHVPADDPLREPLHDRGLAHAGRANQDRIVLGPAREDLDHPPDLLVAADDRVELALLGERGEVAPVLVERLVGALRVRARDPLAAAHRRRRLQQLLAGEPRRSQRFRHRAVLALGQGQQQVLDAHVLVLHLPGEGLRRVQHLVRPRGDVELAGGGARTRHARQLVERLSEALQQRGRAGPRLLHHPGSHSAVLREERHRQMLGVDLRVALPLGQALGLSERLLPFLGQPVGIHGRCSPCRVCRLTPTRRGRGPARVRRGRVAPGGPPRWPPPRASPPGHDADAACGADARRRPR